MRRHLMLSLGLMATCFASCRQRDEIDPETKPDSSLIIQEKVETTTSTMKSADAAKAATADQNPAEKDPPAKVEAETPVEPPIVIVNEPASSLRIESLAFAHSNGMCLQSNSNGEVNLQSCDNKKDGQKFLFSRSLDGRVQLKDTSSERCLAVGPASFFSETYLVGEVCESKASQFFSLVDYGNNYSLKFDGNNSCIDAVSSGTTAGTRLILSKCSADLNQKIKVAKK